MRAEQLRAVSFEDTLHPPGCGFWTEIAKKCVGQTVGRAALSRKQGRDRGGEGQREGGTEGGRQEGAAHGEPWLCHGEEFSSGDAFQVSEKQIFEETGEMC